MLPMVNMYETIEERLDLKTNAAEVVTRNDYFFFNYT